MGEGHYPDTARHPQDEPGPFYFADHPHEHLARLATAFQRALDATPASSNVRVTFTVDVVHKNPGGVSQYKVSLGAGAG